MSSDSVCSAPSTMLPHWSDTSSSRERERERERPTPTVAGILRDLVSWWADHAILLTRKHPEDRLAIERVRRFAFAWLAGEPCPDLSIDELLTTVATLMSGIDRNLGGAAATSADDDERNAIGADPNA